MNDVKGNSGNTKLSHHSLRGGIAKLKAVNL
jgi:hypothetical protein